MKTPHGREEIYALFGYPCRADGSLNQVWVTENIVGWTPPAQWKLFYQDDSVLTPSSGIQVHHLLKEPLTQIFLDVWAHVEADLRDRFGVTPVVERVRAELHDLGMDQHCGGFNFRPITGGKDISLHAVGIAIDMDAMHNPRGLHTLPRFPQWYRDIWAAHGFLNGGTFPTPDWMHFQFATGA